MLQRIQTVYLFIAVLLIALPLFGLDLFVLLSEGQSIHIGAFEVVGKLKDIPFQESNDVYMLQFVLIALVGYVIFSFKNRKRQIFLGWFSLVLVLVTAAWMVLGAFVNASLCAQCQSTSPTPQVAFYLFVSSCIFIFLAVLAIRKDKKLVDSLNRLR